MTVLDTLIQQLKNREGTGDPVLSAHQAIQKELAILEKGLPGMPADARAETEDKIREALALLDSYRNDILNQMGEIRAAKQQSRKGEAACIAYTQTRKKR